VTTRSYTVALAVPLAIMLLSPRAASAQQALTSAPQFEAQRSDPTQNPNNVPAPVQDAENSVERTARRFGIGVEGGIGLDPELIEFGAHGTFGPIFTRNVQFRPGIEFGAGEVTTTFAINLDVLYLLPGSARTTRWVPYVGAGPNFGLSHQGFEGTTAQGNRFNFSDTSFEAGFNFIAGVRNRNGLFMEMKATAYGVSNVKLLVGYTF
jgi:hypothetical protein